MKLSYNDIQVALTAGFLFLLFIVCHLLLFSISGSSKSPLTILRLFVISWFIPMGVFMLYNAIYVLSIIMYSLLTILYFFSIFMIIHSSLHIQLLTKIAESGNTGVSRSVLMNTFAQETLVKKRLDQLVALGELTHQKNYYERVDRFSLLKIRTMLSRTIEVLFP